MPLFLRDSMSRLAATAAPPIRSDVLIISTLMLWNVLAKLLQKSEMRKDIVIELSYKGFG